MLQTVLEILKILIHLPGLWRVARQLSKIKCPKKRKECCKDLADRIAKERKDL